VTDFISKDLWGRTIVLSQDTWDHALRRGHFPQIKGMWATVTATFESTTLVLDNPPLEESRVFGDERHGDARYVQLIPSLGEYLIVPVLVKSDVVSRKGGSTIGPPPVVIALSAFTAPKIPEATVLLRWPPES
jgi:hypothetical protein